MLPNGKQIFLLSEALSLLFLQNHQFWPLETTPQGKKIPPPLFFFLIEAVIIIPGFAI